MHQLSAVRFRGGYYRGGRVWHPSFSYSAHQPWTAVTLRWVCKTIRLLRAELHAQNVNKAAHSCVLCRDPAISCWVLTTKCPLLSQHLPFQPPLCLQLWDHLDSSSPGKAVEDELSITLLSKRQRNSWKACGPAGCWSEREMSSRTWAEFYYVSWRMLAEWLEQLLDQYA